MTEKTRERGGNDREGGGGCGGREGKTKRMR